MKQLLQLRCWRERNAEIALRRIEAQASRMRTACAEAEARIIAMTAGVGGAELGQQEMLKAGLRERATEMRQEAQRLEPLAGSAREQLAAAVRQRQSLETLMEAREQQLRRERERREEQRTQDLFATRRSASRSRSHEPFL